MSVDGRESLDVQAAATPLASRGVFLMSQLGYHVAARAGEILAPMGLETRHYGVLMHLATNEGFSQQRLADAMGVHRNMMVGLIDDLEEHGLVQRDVHPTDRRAHRLRLTDEAHAVLSRADAAIDGLEDEIFGHLLPEDRARLMALLRSVAEAAQLPTGIHPGLRRRNAAR
jgi:DNA-binding MarR family transcriptional regulator